MQPTENISFAPFESKYISGARELWFNSEGIGLSSADEPAELEKFISRNPGLSFVSLAGGRVTGTILCGHDGRRGLIHHLAVATAMRRKGVGRDLLGRGMEALSASGIRKCHLLIFKNNEGGMAFWRAVGGEERVSLSLFSLSTSNTKDV